jgi:methionyl-tRNA synthetase
VNRALTMITKFGAEFPPVRDDSVYGGTENPYWQLEVAATEAAKQAAAQFETIAPSRALELIWRFVGVANRFVDQTQPWAMGKAKDPKLGHTLWSLQASLWLIARLIAPVLPATSKSLRAWIADAPEQPATWPEAVDGRVLPLAPATLKATPPSPMFPRLDDKAQAAILKKVVGEDVAAPATSTPSTTPAPKAAPKPAERAPALAPITIDDFGKVELRTGKVLSAVAVPKKKKLLHLSVDLGEAAPRSIVAGVAEAYAPDALVGRQVIVVANLAPATIAGIKSEGMILAAGDEIILGLSALDRDVPPGTRVR